MKNVDWRETKAAIVRRGELRAVADKELRRVSLDALKNIERQKSELVENTRKFVEGRAAQHALLWGEMGCGKSSLVRAVFFEFVERGLRLVEISRSELTNLFEVLEVVRACGEFKFVIFCDDFSFEKNEAIYGELKNLLEGSIQAPPSNALFYATSNRKHILKQEQANDENFLLEKENSREMLSLADRFGLWVSFYELEMSEYLALVWELVGERFGEAQKERILREARAFAAMRGNRSGRSAEQFAASL